MWAILLLYIVSCTTLLTAAALLELQEVGRIPTAGCNGLEFFSTSGVDYVVAANFWDGKSPDMSAMSALFRLSVDNSSTRIHAEMIQGFPTKGAHGADFFTHGDYNMLAIPSYYGCQQEEAECYSTVLYLWDQVRGKFVVFQQFKTSGPSQTDHLVEEDGGAVFLFIAENFSSRLSVYRFEPGPRRFEPFQNIYCPGVAGLAVLQVQQRSLLAVASYHNKGWRTSSLVLSKEVGRENKFKKLQDLETFGAHDAEMVLHHDHDQVLLFFSEDRNDSTSKVYSQLFSLPLPLLSSEAEASGAEAGGRFVKVQDLPTDGAHAAEFFFSSSPPLLHLAVANFGDRQGERVEAKSSLWLWDDTKAALVPTLEVETKGATDWEHLPLSPHPTSPPNTLAYLAVCNEGDIGKQLHQESVLFRLAGALGGGEGGADEL